jgi:ATP-binding cassette subfamily C (CFTR/MRP) protein 1
MVKAAVMCLRVPLLRTLPPRAAMIAFSYAQTFLITATINYLETPSALRNKNHANGLIGAAFIIYTGNAVCFIQFIHFFDILILNSSSVLTTCITSLK